MTPARTSNGTGLMATFSSQVSIPNVELQTAIGFLSRRRTVQYKALAVCRDFFGHQNMLWIYTPPRMLARGIHEGLN